MARLHDGINVLAVEIHQGSAGSSDISFDLELVAHLASPPVTVMIDVSPPARPGDLNGDSRVGLIDLALMSRNFRRTSPPAVGDLDGDGQIERSDVVRLLGDYGQSTAPPAPSAKALVSEDIPRPSRGLTAVDRVFAGWRNRRIRHRPYLAQARDGEDWYASRF